MLIIKHLLNHQGPYIMVHLHRNPVRAIKTTPNEGELLILGLPVVRGELLEDRWTLVSVPNCRPGE